MSTIMQRCWRCNDKTGGCDYSCMMSGPAFQPSIPAPVKGCICPPTSERTCQRWDCGRKDAKVSYGATSTQPAKPTTGE